MSENGQPDRVFGEDRPKSFVLHGHTFRLRPVKPEAFAESLRQAQEVEGKTDATLEELFAIRDERILLSIVPEQHDEWRELRGREDSPVELRDLDEIRNWLTEVHTGRPPQVATSSSGGPGSAAASSRAASPSPAVVRPG